MGKKVYSRIDGELCEDDEDEFEAPEEQAGVEEAGKKQEEGEDEALEANAGEDEARTDATDRDQYVVSIRISWRSKVRSFASRCLCRKHGKKNTTLHSD